MVALKRPALVALMLLVASSALLADARESYRQGLEAYERQDYQEAARLFTRAIAEDPEASGLLSGALLRRYTPHLYLGLSLAQLGLCREAVRALDESERQGKVRDRELESLRSARNRCQRLVEDVEAAAGTAAEISDGAAAVAYELARLETLPVLRSVWRSGNPSFAERKEEAAALLTEARNRIEAGQQALDRNLIEEGASLARQATERYESLTADAEAARDRLQSRVRARLEELGGLADQTEQEARFVRSRFGPLPREIAEVVEVTEASIEVARRADEGTSLALIDQLENELRASLRRLRGAVQAPPEELMDAAAALFRGDYARVEELLSERQYRDGRAAEQACLLLAAARYGSLRAEGATDEDQASGVREVLDRCATPPSRVELPARYFAPELRALWSSLRSAESTTAPE